MRQTCSQCRAIVIGPVTVVEVSRCDDRGAKLDRFLLCAECGERVRQNLSRRSELPDTLAFDRPLPAVTIAARPAPRPA